MLYDPKWEVKANPLSIESLVAWLETQDPQAQYNFCDDSVCLLAQYFVAKYGPVRGVEMSREATNGHWQRGNPYSKLYDISLAPTNSDGIATYGAALEKAREALVTD